jgi:hypothetical protein
LAYFLLRTIPLSLDPTFLEFDADEFDFSGAVLDLIAAPRGNNCPLGALPETQFGRDF